MKVKSRIKNITLITGFCFLGGTSLVITAIASPGSVVDRQEFCFKPDPIYQTQKIREYDKKGNYKTKTVRTLIPQSKVYCKGDKLYIGVSWRIAEAIDNNPELRKIHFKRKLKAKRPLAGMFLLGGSVLLFTSWIIWNIGTELYFDNLQKIIREKELKVIETKLEQQKEIELLTNKTAQQTQFIKEVQDRKHGEALSTLMSEGEKVHHQDIAKKKRELLELQHDLKKADVKAETAERLEKEAKHKVETKKLTGKLDDPWNDESEKESLKDLLKNHEQGWLWDLVGSTKPIVIYGESGCYKSYTAACLVLLKVRFCKAKLESIADPQWHQNRKKAWKELIQFEPVEYGESSNWYEEQNSYEDGIKTLLDRCKLRTEEDEPLISVWDELTKLGHYLPELAKKFMPEVVSSPRKANEHTILLTHSLTQKGLGGVEGMSEAIKDGTFRLQLRGTNKQTPLFKGKLDGWVNSDGEKVEEYQISLPEWFRPEKIKELL